MKKVLCALGMAVASMSTALATTYPLTIENCGYKETFTKAPERVVAPGRIPSRSCFCWVWKIR